jgi:hypothetical protein
MIFFIRFWNCSDSGIFRFLFYHSQELKEQSANGLGELIDITSPEALKVSGLHITGPLIRILGDRFVWSLKVAVLDTLPKLLTKV